MENTTFCQSCGMPMGDNNELYGHNSDGSKSSDYCQYCYDHGAFLKEETMQEMVESCIPHVIEANPDMTPEAARKMMNDFFPTLKRWSK